MAATLEVESTLTDRYQATVPETVRRALKLGKRNKIRYTIQPNGAVFLTRADAQESDDPVLGQFFGFLAKDISKHPECLVGFREELATHIQLLVYATAIDLNAELSTDDE